MSCTQTGMSSLGRCSHAYSEVADHACLKIHWWEVSLVYSTQPTVDVKDGTNRKKTCVGYQNQAQSTGYQFGTSRPDHWQSSVMRRNQLNNQTNKNESQSISPSGYKANFR